MSFRLWYFTAVGVATVVMLLLIRVLEVIARRRKRAVERDRAKIAPYSGPRGDRTRPMDAPSERRDEKDA